MQPGISGSVDESYSAPNSLNDLLARYGFAGPVSSGGVLDYRTLYANPAQPAGDWAGLQADPAFAPYAGTLHQVLPGSAELSQLEDPHGPGNGQGGSDLANIALGLAFVGGGAALVNSLAGAAASASVADAAPSVASSYVGDLPTVFDAATVTAPAGAGTVLTAANAVSTLKTAASVASAGATLERALAGTSSAPNTLTIPAFSSPSSAAGTPQLVPYVPSGAQALPLDQVAGAGLQLTSGQQIAAGVAVASLLVFALYRKG